MKKSVGDGLDALATAILLVAVLWFVFRVGAGLAHHMNGYSQEQARCVSISGVYGDGKCYVNGDEK